MSEKQQQTRGAEKSEADADTSAIQFQNSEGSTETERLRTENETLKNSLRMRGAHDDITRLLAEAGARSPGLLFTAARDHLQFTEDGKLANAAAITEHLRRRFPEQFESERPFGSIDGGAGASRSNQYLSTDALSKMTPAQIKELDWQEVRRVLSER